MTAVRTAEFTSTDPLVGDARTETPNHRHIWVGQLPLWVVIRVVLTVHRRLPFRLYEQTFSV